MRRRQTRHDTPLVQLNRWQLTGLLLGLGVTVAVVFFAGVIVGRQSTAPLPPALAHIAAPTGGDARPGRGAKPHGEIYEVRPGTREINGELSQPSGDVVARDPTERARIETHRQIQRGRAFGAAGVEGAESATDDGARVAAPAPVSGQGSGANFTLQVSVFETQAPAAAVAAELKQSGYPAVLRQVRGGGRAFWQVEVGRFSSAQQGSTFQRRFERRSGYSGVLIPAP